MLRNSWITSAVYDLSCHRCFTCIIAVDYPFSVDGLVKLYGYSDFSCYVCDKQVEVLLSVIHQNTFLRKNK